MAGDVNRRDFLQALGITVGAATLGATGGSTAPNVAEAQAKEPPKGSIPDKPIKIGHMTFFTGAAAVLGEPSYKGHILAAEEIKLPTVFVDGCTDFLFDKAVPNPHYIFRITNMQSADGVTCAVAVAQTWPDVRKIAHVHPDYSYGRNLFDHFNVAINRLIPGTQVVSDGWPKLGTSDFASHITKAISAKPDLLITGVWGGDYIAFYKQALRYDLFKKMKLATTVAFGV